MALTRGVACLGASLVLAAQPGWARDPVARFDAAPLQDLFEVASGEIAQRRAKDGTAVYRWVIGGGQTSVLELADACPFKSRLRYFDRLLFEYQIAEGQVSSLGVSAFGHVPGPRQGKVHQWGLAAITTPAGTWRTVQIDLDQPSWFPWDKKDGQDTDTFLRLKALAASPRVVIELRNVRLAPDYIWLKPYWQTPVEWPRLVKDEDGAESYEMTFRVSNLGPGAQRVTAEVASDHELFQVSVTPTEADIAPFSEETFTMRAGFDAQKAQRRPLLYNEDLTIAFLPESDPEAVYLGQTWLVVPLSGEHRRQVVYAADDLATLRERLPQDEDLRKAFRYEGRLANAEGFLNVRLDHIPGTRSWGHTPPKCPACKDAPFAPGEAMPEAVCKKCGHREVSTPAACHAWKLWMMRGGLDDLGAAYLLTGDEKYARKAIDLFLLYGAQYERLPWDHRTYDQRHFYGSPVLVSSRIAASTSYGTNMLLKAHFRCLSMIADSPSWTEETRAQVYEGFVVPCATELIKFPGGISNMTDITNHDLVLAGLVFGDATILHRGLLADGGLAKRLTDITADGFSSEGRPLNYHFAGMTEYLPTLLYVRNSGLPIELPYERLLAAVRMPLERATLTGHVPASGDAGAGWGMRPSSHYDVVYELFPEAEWLYELGRQSTVRTLLKSVSEPPARDAWKTHLRREPTLFRDAGMAILREGDTADEQVYATLDYGRNVMHAGLDRLHMAVWALGRSFSPGPGSSYNAATNWERGVKEALAFIGHGSLGHNVIIADTSDQLPAIGRLLCWHDKPEYQAIAAEVTGHHPGVTHRRALVMRDKVLIVLDEVTSDTEHTYDFVYHNFGDVSPGEGWTARPADAPLGNRANYQNIRDLRALRDAGDLRLRWRIDEGVSLDLWQAAGEGRAYIGLTGCNNPDRRIVGDDIATVFVRREGTTARFVTVLAPYKTESPLMGAEAAMQGKGFGASVRLRGAEAFTVLFNPTAKAASVIRMAK
ncbi:MAG: heparinase II/III family protein [Armatimonadota bacterium]